MMALPVLLDGEELEILEAVVLLVLVLVVDLVALGNRPVRRLPDSDVFSGVGAGHVASLLPGLRPSVAVLVPSSRTCWWSSVHRMITPLSRCTSYSLAYATNPALSGWAHPWEVITRSLVVTSSILTRPLAVSTGVSPARQRLPPERSRSTSSGVWAPKILPSAPLLQVTVVPPAVCLRRRPGSWSFRPLGPLTQEVTASPRVGPMMPTQCPPGT